MSLLIKRPGILTTIQDLGRQGHRDLGINPSGAMDRTALRILNTLLGNDRSEAALEMHFPAVEAVFEKAATIAVGGADFVPMLDGEAIPLWTTMRADPGSRLTFAEPRRGARTYLSVAGGFDLPEWLGSSSTNLAAAIGGFHGRALEAGDRLPFRSGGGDATSDLTAGRSIIPIYSRHPTVRVVPGAEFGLLTAMGEGVFRDSSFTVTNDSNRMGYRLAGPQLHLLHKKELLSAAVTYGTIQLMPDGSLTILMADHQTSGGYPRIAGVIGPDLPLLAQLGPGDKASFHIIDIEEAERVTLALERDLAVLRTAVRLRG
jgi:antagonist of KipI